MTQSSTWAVVTGASSGLGSEFSRQLAARGHSVCLVARDAARLAELARGIEKKYSVATEVLAADLHDSRQRALVAQRLNDPARAVSWLVNNAGYGIAGDLAESDWESELHHHAIHVTAPLELTKAALPGMLERGLGRIVLVSSVAGYLSRGTYSAHKAWGLSLARSLSARYRTDGVVVSAVAPGFTRTEFHQRMDMNVSRVPGWMWLRAERVVADALRAAERGKAVSIPSLRYKALLAVASLTPKRWHQAGV